MTKRFGYIIKMNTNKIQLFPLTAKVNQKKHLQIGGCDCIDLVKEYGTPLYVFDEFTLREKCRQFKVEFNKVYDNNLIIYASKAFINKAIASIIKDEGLGLDIVSGGELYVAQSISFPSNKIYFHGNNKSYSELEEALNYKIGRVVVDNFYELEILNEIAKKFKMKQDILLRVSPGIDAHTHKYTTTGVLDSKFGFPISTGQAEKAIQSAMSLSNVNLIGLHFHLGSPIFDTTPYKQAIQLVIKFSAEMQQKYSFSLEEFSPGGGFAVTYTTENRAPEVATYATDIANSLIENLNIYSLKFPKLILEPGRAIIAQAGVAFYKIGGLKEIPNIRRYIFVDGGMGDNIRPALYQAKYEALVANKADSDENDLVTIAGKYCESGDILIKDIKLAEINHEDIIAIPVAGAYAPAMASNYNLIPRPAIVIVNNGQSRLIRKRETYNDLVRSDLS